MSCPKTDIRFCPLYVAAHDPALSRFSCLGADWADGCLVEKGLASFDELTTALRAQAPKLVATVEWSESAEAIRAQRQRNMRAAGVH